MVQEPSTADYDGMPKSAAASGLADFILPPDQMPDQLMNYIEKAIPVAGAEDPVPAETVGGALKKIFVLLRAQTGHDFSGYKTNAIRRRMTKRMVVNQIEDLNHYARHLRRNPVELEALFRDLLISVTNFFRDPKAFDALNEKVIGALLDRDPERPIRIWVPGCATGEEAYSIAMLIHERMKAKKRRINVQIFATDIDGDAIETARSGVYPAGVTADVKPRLMSRFFLERDGFYRINDTIRQWLIFAEQNVISDPPFSKVDLISCRNLLIYLDPASQRRVLSVFHYALQPGGYLFLGHSESIGGLADDFSDIDRSWKIYQRRETVQGRNVSFRTRAGTVEADPVTRRSPRQIKAQKLPSYRDLAEQTLLEQFAPAGAVVNEHGEVLYFHGRTGRYLEPASGEASLRLDRMAREGLKIELTMALRKAVRQRREVSCRDLKIGVGDRRHTFDLTVRPLPENPQMPRLFMVTFQDVEKGRSDEDGVEADSIDGVDKKGIVELERELRSKEEYLQSTIEDLQTSNEEMQSSNEELQSANEELQSSNEELETSKEELQSVNEELVTVNLEVQEKIAELTQVNNDVANLLSGTGIGTVFLDADLKIRMFTPQATQVINLIESDIGRPVSHLSSTLFDHETLTEDVRRVLDSLAPYEKEVRTVDGDWFLMRIQPYRTLENVIDGVVLTFVDILRLKRAEAVIQTERDYAEQLLETIREPLVILDSDFLVVSANRSFYSTFEVSSERVAGQNFFSLGRGHWDIPRLRKLLRDVLPEKTVFDDFVVENDFPGIGPRKLMLNGRQVRREKGEKPLILLAMEDVTDALDRNVR